MSETRVPLRATLRALGPHVRVIGHTDGPRLFGQDLTFKPHLMVTGESRSGKGGTQRTLICGHLDVGNEVRICAPDPGEFGLFEGACDIAADPEDQLRALRETESDMNDRRAELAAADNPLTETKGLAHFLQMPNPWPRKIIIIDEAPALLGEAALLTFDKRTMEEIYRIVSSIVARGAKVGVNAIVAAQYPTVEYMFGGSRLGGGIRANLGARIHCDGISESLVAVFDAGTKLSQSALTTLRTGGVGRCVYVFLQTEDKGAGRAGQVMWIEDADARAIAVDYINRRKLETV